jgi:hypothetical protein
MPRSKKSASKAKSQWKSGQSSFGPVKFDTEDTSSEYNGSKGNDSSDDEENTLQSISAMQTLYSVFLPAHLRQKEGSSAGGVSANSIIIECLTSIFTKVQKAKGVQQIGNLSGQLTNKYLAAQEEVEESSRWVSDDGLFCNGKPIKYK